MYSHVVCVNENSADAVLYTIHQVETQAREKQARHVMDEEENQRAWLLAGKAAASAPEIRGSPQSKQGQTSTKMLDPFLESFAMNFTDCLDMSL